jgi:hypothetical protein
MWNALAMRRTPEGIEVVKKSSSRTKRPNKQHDARAASFKRIAKGIRASVKSSLPYRADTFLSARGLSKVFDEEAKLLRSMR